MRRSLNPTDEPAASPPASEPDGRPGAVRAWDAFFFTPADPLPLGLVRIVVGVLLLWNFAWLGVDLMAWLGPDGWADPEVVAEAMLPGGWSFWLWTPPALIGPLYLLGLGVLVLFTLGLGTRTMAVLAWVLVMSTNRRMPVMLFGFDNAVATWTLYLAVCGSSGRALSLDRLLARRRGGDSGPPSPSVGANLGLRLIQLHLCLIYASAGLAKLQGTPWWDGTAVGMLLGNSDFRTTDLSALAEYPRLLQAATHATVFLELLYPILIWFRGWRPWMLAGAVGMHLGIAVAMGLFEFSLAMIAANLAFVPARWLRALRFGRRGRAGASVVESPGGPDSPPPASRTRRERERDRPTGRAPR